MLMRTHTHALMHTHINTHTHTHTHMHTQTHTHKHPPSHSHTHMHACTHTDSHTHACAYIFVLVLCHCLSLSLELLSFCCLWSCCPSVCLSVSFFLCLSLSLCFNHTTDFPQSSYLVKLTRSHFILRIYYRCLLLVSASIFTFFSFISFSSAVL